jgi:UDP-glucuronate 4-epimerase
VNQDTSEQRSGQRIVVTGAAGFIGSHLTDRLLADGASVLGIDSFDGFYDPAAKRSNIAAASQQERFTLVEGDIRDPGVLAHALVGADTVVHLAALAGVRRSLRIPAQYQDVNVTGTTRLLEACREAGIQRVVFASSSSVYGNNRKVPFAEDDRVDHPISAYAASKKAGELICHTYHGLYGMDITCLRFFTVYGPRQRPDLAIHKFARLITAGEPIPFFGDGSMERDHTYIDDIIAGVRAAIDTCPGSGYRIINLGSDRPVRLDDLVRAIEQALGKQATLDRRPAPACEVTRTWADLTRARASLGYAPRTSLADGLAAFVNWLADPNARSTS